MYYRINFYVYLFFGSDRRELEKEPERGLERGLERELKRWLERKLEKELEEPCPVVACFYLFNSSKIEIMQNNLEIKDISLII